METRLLVGTVVSSIILTACGGGGEVETKSTIASVPTVTAQVSEPVELFTTVPIMLPDLKSKYDRLCGRNVNVQNAIPVDINKDGKMDLLFDLWCMIPQVGMAFNGDVPNGLVVLIQESNGKFVDKTVDVFGNDLPSIGGIAIDNAVYDFNGDGVKDVIYAVNREDGRLPDSGEVENQKSSAVALMSDGNGKYKIVSLNKPEYGYRVTLKDNSRGTKDIVLMPFAAPSAYTFNNSWIKIDGYSWVSNYGTTFFKEISSGLGSTIAVSPSPHPRTGVELWNGTANTWRKINEYKFPDPILVPMQNKNGYTGYVPMFTIDGKDYVTPSITDTCELNRSSSSREVLVMYFASEIVGGYKGETILEGQNNLKGVYELMLFDTNNGNSLSKIKLSITPYNIKSALKKVACEDINNDGFSDIQYYQPQGGPPSGEEVTYPTIFVNDSKGEFNQISTKWFPRPGNGTSYVYEDLNGDGIRDLLYFPLTGYTGHNTDFGVLTYGHPIQSDSVKYHLYLGKRKLKQSDLVQ